MPNFKKHITVGAAVGSGANLFWQLCKILDAPNRPQNFWELCSRIDLFEVAAFGAIGAGCAALPDMIEPATSPNHRAAFHSITCAGAVLYGAFGKHTKNLLPDQKHFLSVVALTYLSHLVLDNETPKGLPLLGFSAIKFS